MMGQGGGGITKPGQQNLDVQCHSGAMPWLQNFSDQEWHDLQQHTAPAQSFKTFPADQASSTKLWRPPSGRRGDSSIQLMWLLQQLEEGEQSPSWCFRKRNCVANRLFFFSFRDRDQWASPSRGWEWRRRDSQASHSKTNMKWPRTGLHNLTTSWPQEAQHLDPRHQQGKAPLAFASRTLATLARSSPETSAKASR